MDAPLVPQPKNELVPSKEPLPIYFDVPHPTSNLSTNWYLLDLPKTRECIRDPNHLSFIQQRGIRVMAHQTRAVGYIQWIKGKWAFVYNASLYMERIEEYRFAARQFVKELNGE